MTSLETNKTQSYKREVVVSCYHNGDVFLLSSKQYSTVSIIKCTFHCYNNRKLGKTQTWNIKTCLEKYYSYVCSAHTWYNFCCTDQVMILRYYCYFIKRKHLLTFNFICQRSVSFYFLLYHFTVSAIA